MALSKGYIQNLGNKKIMKFIYNPETFTYTEGLEFAELKAPGLAHPIHQYVGGESTEISVQIFCDGRETKNGVKNWETFLHSFLPIHYNNPMTVYAPPPPALFAYGWFVRKVVITNVTWEFTLFDSALNPIRGTADVTMRLVP
jgi:hypothetical protein